MLLFENDLIGSALRVVLTFGMIFGGFVYLLVWAERKVSAFIQCRIGPNRLGPAGVLQGLADGIKFAFKESIRPEVAHWFFYPLAPFLAVFPAVLAFGAIPYGARKIDGEIVPLMIANIDVGVLFALSISSLGVFSLLLAGWASNSKYPALGGLRAAAQMISYEIPMGMAIMTVVLLAGSVELPKIVQAQMDSTWYIFLAPIAFLVFVIAIFAETNRLPFDMPEGESEIVGYHAEYSAMKFAMFFMAEYANMFTVSCMTVLLFFAGWEFLPGISWDKLSTWVGVDILASSSLWLLSTLWFFAKVGFFLFFFIWVRWTLPRFRYDQLMAIGWKRLIPISVINLLVTAIVLAWVNA